jgi:phosphatidate cytidylyltransferase
MGFDTPQGTDSHQQQSEVPPVSRRKPNNLAVRVLTAALAIPLLIYMLLWGPRWAFTALIGAACAMAALELFQICLPSQSLLQAWGLLATLALLGVTMFFYAQPLAVIGSLAVLVVAAMIAGLARPEPVSGAAARVGWLIAGPIYIGGLIGIIGLLFLGEQGGYWVLFAMLVTWFGDTAAYFVGKGMGRYKLYPLVSPNKTIEGAIAGLLGSAVAALLAHFWFLPALPLTSGITVAVIAGGLGQLGDLAESLLKRSSGVKDSGWVIPGHGGILDRIDALLFAAPVIWFYVQWYF